MKHAWYVTFEVPRRGTLIRRRSPRSTRTFETETEAKNYFDHYVHQKGDWVAATNLVETLGINAQTLPAETLREFLKANGVAMTGGSTDPSASVVRVICVRK